MAVPASSGKTKERWPGVTPFCFAMGSMDHDSLRRQNTLRSARQFSRGQQNFPG